MTGSVACCDLEKVLEMTRAVYFINQSIELVGAKHALLDTVDLLGLDCIYCVAAAGLFDLPVGRIVSVSRTVSNYRYLFSLSLLCS